MVQLRKGLSTRAYTALLALIVRESETLTLEELARDASSLSKGAARLSTKMLRLEALRQQLTDTRSYLSQMPECQ